MIKIFKKREKPWYEKGGYPKPIRPAKLDRDSVGAARTGVAGTARERRKFGWDDNEMCARASRGK